MGALEIMILLLDARQHAVEGFHQLADFIEAVCPGPNRVIFVARLFPAIAAKAKMGWDMRRWNHNDTRIAPRVEMSSTAPAMMR